MMNINSLHTFSLLIAFVFCSQSFAGNEQKHYTPINERVGHIDNNIEIIHIKDKNVKVEKLTRIKNKFMTFYTINGDSTNIYLFTKTLSSIPTKRDTWEYDTIRLKTRDSSLLTTHNLSIFNVNNRFGNECIKIFCGKDSTYESTIRNKYDLEKPFSRLSNYNTGRIMGAYFNKDDDQFNVYFSANSSSLTRSNDIKRKYLYRISQNNDYNVWGDPVFVYKHNLQSFDTYNFAKSINGNSIKDYVIMSFDCDNIPYYSKFNYEIKSWEYATEMSEKVSGNNHKVFIGKNIVYVVFFKKIENDILNDMYIWYGKIRDFEKGCKNGDLLKVTNNSEYKNLSNKEKLIINSSMNADIVIKKHSIITTISAKWKSNLPCYALKFEIKEKSISPNIQNIIH